MIAGSWTSASVARAYINKSLFVKRNVADMISKEINKLNKNANLIFSDSSEKLEIIGEAMELDAGNLDFPKVGEKRSHAPDSSGVVLNIGAGAVVNFTGVSFGNFNSTPEEKSSRATFEDDDLWVQLSQSNP